MLGYGIGVGAARGALGAAGFALWWSIVVVVGGNVQQNTGFAPGAALLDIPILAVFAALLAVPVGAVAGAVLGAACVPVAQVVEPRTAAWLCGAPVGLLAAVCLPWLSAQDAGPLQVLLLGPVPGLLCGSVAAWHGSDLAQRWFG